MIKEADVYLFLLKCLYDQILSPEELIEIFKNRPQLSWVVYRSVINCLLWAGSGDYLNTNKSVFDEAYHIFGDFGIIFLDVFYGVKLDVSVFWNMIDDEKKAHVNRLREMVTQKTDVFRHLLLFFRIVEVPNQIPISSGDWLGIAESMFWSSQFPDNTSIKIDISEESIMEAFTKLELEVLSKLMLGLHFYSNEYNQIRLKSAPVV